MRPSGLAEVEAAKADGRSAAAYGSQRNATVPPDLAAALAASPQAAQAFDALSKTQQYAVILNLVTARAATARTAQLHSAITALEARGALRAAPAEASPYRRSLSELAAQRPPPILRILRAVVDGEAAVDVQLAG
jgi:hypothetical protein